MTVVSPSTSSTAYGVSSSIFGLARARLTMICEARKSLRRWTSVTLVPKRVRKSASSNAESPPPTTTIVFSLKKAPSQVAQAETPRPWSRCSESSPSQRALAPVATITEPRPVLVLVDPDPERPLGEVDARSRRR